MRHNERKAMVMLGKERAASRSRSGKLPVRWRFGRRRLRGGEDGATLVELAFVFPILLALLFGIIEFAYAFYTYQDVSDVARRATRWAAVRGSASCNNTPGLHNEAGYAPYTCPGGATADDITSFVQNFGYPGLKGSSLGVTSTWLQVSTGPTVWTTCKGVCNAAGNEVQVKVTYPFTISVPFWKVTTITLHSTSTMVIAQ
jgi:Flp pilus assembly protein TadG